MDILQSHIHNINPEPNTGCWIWSGPLNKGGYGRISLNGRNIFTHRLSYEMSIGEIPKGLFVCHKCDQPSCVNPDHLFVGTARDNFNDMFSKNRHSFDGLSTTGNPKLSKKQVNQIRSLKGKRTLKSLAKEFNVTFPTIHYILKGKTWQE